MVSSMALKLFLDFFCATNSGNEVAKSLSNLKQVIFSFPSLLRAYAFTAPLVINPI